MSWTAESASTESKAKVICNGRETEFDPGTPITQAVAQAVRENGLRKFDVILNGETLDSPEDDPSVRDITLQAGDRVEVVPYNVAA